MKKKINRQLMGIAAVAILATLFLTLVVFYNLFRTQVIDDLKTYVHIIENADGANEDSIEAYNARGDGLRITLIKSDGTVIYDTEVADVSRMANHADRKEVREALEHGEGSDVRKSATLEKSTYYYTVRLSDGNVLRVAKEASSIVSVFFSIMPVLMMILSILFIMSIFMSRWLTRSLINPIEKMADHLDEENARCPYEELVPFVDTINRQHADIMKNARMRQEFTANVSHELKTPLTSISGYAELIENDMAGDNVQRFAYEIHRNAARLLTLINDIIRLSQLDSPELDEPMEPLDLYPVAQTCVEMLQMSAEEHGVSLTLAGEPGMVYGNRKMLDELLYNLTDNAIRYNRRDGSVAVYVENATDSVSGQPAVRLTVRDTGIGIPRESQERIFERFYRVDKSRSKQTGGTGLGLAIVKHIVAHHDAHLTLKSEVGRGTTIIVDFPPVTLAESGSTAVRTQG